MINGLYRESQRNLWFFDSLEMMDSRFGDLATPDMEEVFREALTSPTRNETLPRSRRVFWSKHFDTVRLFRNLRMHFAGCESRTIAGGQGSDIVPSIRFFIKAEITSRPATSLWRCWRTYMTARCLIRTMQLLGQLLNTRFILRRLSAAEILQYLRTCLNIDNSVQHV